MKTFTYAQKKWAMASALLLVLGFNVSFNSHNGGVASAELASESDEVITSKITTAKGVADVTYIKAGDKKVLALLPKYVEGKGFCEDCERDQYVLKDMAFDKNTKDIDALNVAVMAKLEEQKAKPVVKADEEKPEKPEEKAKPKAKATFTEKTLKVCEREDESNKVDCYLTQISSVLSDEKANQKEVTAFYGKYVQQQLAKQIASTEDGVGDNAIASLISLKDGLEMEKGWVELRKRTSMTLAAAVGYTGNTVKTFYTNGMTATNPNQVAYWMNLYQYGSNKLDAMANAFYGEQQGFVSRSVQNGTLSFVDQDGVLNAYSTPANQIITTFKVSPQSFNFVNGQLISTGVVTQPGTTLPGQISVPNAGIGTQPQLPGTSVGPTMPGSIDPTLVAPRLAPGRGVGQQTQVVTPTLVPSTTLPGATATTNTNGVQYIMVPVGRQ